jgi:hypothetical protein
MSILALSPFNESKFTGGVGKLCKDILKDADSYYVITTLFDYVFYYGKGTDVKKCFDKIIKKLFPITFETFPNTSTLTCKMIVDSYSHHLSTLYKLELDKDGFLLRKSYVTNSLNKQEFLYNKLVKHPKFNKIKEFQTTNDIKSAQAVFEEIIMDSFKVKADYEVIKDLLNFYEFDLSDY